MDPLFLLSLLVSVGLLLGSSVVLALAGVSASVGTSVERATAALANTSRGRRGRAAVDVARALSSLAIATPRSSGLLLAALDELHQQPSTSCEEGEEVRQEVERAVRRACATLAQLCVIAAALLLVCVDLAGSGRLWSPTQLHLFLVQAQPHALWTLAGALIGGVAQECLIRTRQLRLDEEVERLQPLLCALNSAGLLDDCAEDDGMAHIPITHIAVPAQCTTAAGPVAHTEAQEESDVSIEVRLAEEATTDGQLLPAV